MMLLAEELTEQRWTMEEIIGACSLICSDPELAKEATYAGAITPPIFALARDKMGARLSGRRWCSGCQATTAIDDQGLCPDCGGKDYERAA
jgi:uncharacterized paraquat-inducible protein A